MDPQANMERQRELAARIIAWLDTDDDAPANYEEIGELADLVQALDGWRGITRTALLDEARDLLCEQIRDPVGEANPEYTRGIVELISRATASVADDLDALAAEIGVKL